MIRQNQASMSFRFHSSTQESTKKSDYEKGFEDLLGTQTADEKAKIARE